MSTRILLLSYMRNAYLSVDHPKRCLICAFRLFAKRYVRKSSRRTEEQGGLPCNFCSFFLSFFFFCEGSEPANCRATGRGNGRNRLSARARPRAATARVFGCALYTRRRESRADISRARCSHRSRRKVRDGENERERDRQKESTRENMRGDSC